MESAVAFLVIIFLHELSCGHDGISHGSFISLCRCERERVYSTIPRLFLEILYPSGRTAGPLPACETLIDYGIA